MTTSKSAAAPVGLGVSAPSGSRCNQSISDQKGPTIMPETSDSRDYHGHHVTWCTNRDAEFTKHTEDEPYCSRLIHGVRLNPVGEIQKRQVWVLSTSAFTHGRFTPAEYSDRDDLYNGVELSIEQWRGTENGWDDEQKLRISSDAARSLAAALIRAADIEQGLTR